MTNLVIYPKRGFLNTSFKVKSQIEDDYKVIFKGTTISEGKIKAGTTVSLPKFCDAGYYTIEFSKAKERQQICVENAIRLGSSNLKKSYVFDNFPYIVFVMKDRIHLYDPIVNTYIYTENYLSPNNIQAINDTKLLFSTEHDNGISISVFDVNSFSISKEKDYKKIIAFSKNMSTFYALSEESNSVNLVNTTDLSNIENIRLSENGKYPNYSIDDKNGALYLIGENSIYSIDLNSGSRRIVDSKNAIGITNNGYLIKYIAENQYNYEDLRPNSIAKGTFRHETSGIRNFKGNPIKNVEWQNEPCRSIDDIVSEYKADCERKISIGEKPEIMENTGLIEDRISIEIYPTSKGVYIVEQISEKTFKHLEYFNDSKRVRGVNLSMLAKLFWISNRGYVISYVSERAGCFSNPVCVNGCFATLPLTSTEFVVVKNGEIMERFESLSEAKEKVSPSQKSTTVANIIINGKEIPPYNIIGKSCNKLICKLGNSYNYYERGNSQQEWGDPKKIELEEEKHTRAKMSLDGHYIVYSKGGNKYALYNIAKQTEETILTGNFIDFDKSGNLLFMDDLNGNSKGHRELRIYNPITFEWANATPEYYRFISPDGKLYARTGIRIRYYNLTISDEISEDQYNAFISNVNTDIGKEYSKDEIEEIRNRRHKIIVDNLDYFQSYAARNQYKDSWIDNIQEPGTCHDFSRFCLETRQYVVIGIAKSNKEIEIEVGHQLSFLNYISFSYDNKYVGIVGKPTFNGYLKLSKIYFNETDNIIRLEEDICDMEIANKATWTCAFTKQGLFGTYDSNPNLYLIEQSKFDCFTKENMNDFSFLKQHFMIPNRSLLCFSPSGKYMALSNQGYEAISLGGKGHVPSNKVFIYSTSSKEMLASWNDQGAAIAYRNVANAGFSADDTKLMTVSQDGVIVVRNIQEILENEKYPLSQAS